MSEWSIVSDSKSDVPARGPGVRIPPSPRFKFHTNPCEIFFAHSPSTRSTNGFAAHNPFNTVRVFTLYSAPPRAQNRGVFRPTSFHSVKFLSTTYDAKLWGILTANAIRLLKVWWKKIGVNLKTLVQFPSTDTAKFGWIFMKPRTRIWYSRLQNLA